MENDLTKALGVTFNGSVTFNGPMFDIHDNENVFVNMEKKESTQNKHRSEEANKVLTLHEALDMLMPLLKFKRHWFPIVKVLMWKNYVPLGDFAGAVALIESVLPNVKLDAKDLGKLNVLSFSKELEMWNPNNAPVGGNLFEQYKSIASNAMNVIPDKE